jgi:hypothetical protein
MLKRKEEKWYTLQQFVSIEKKETIALYRIAGHVAEALLRTRTELSFRKSAAKQKHIMLICIIIFICKED